jgi:hypothetical protein
MKEAQSFLFGFSEGLIILRTKPNSLKKETFLFRHKIDSFQISGQRADIFTHPIHLNLRKNNEWVNQEESKRNISFGFDPRVTILSPEIIYIYIDNGLDLIIYKNIKAVPFENIEVDFY